MGQDELDLIEPLSPPPVLNRRRPAMASVAEAVDEDDSCGVPGGSREDERGHAVDGHFEVGFLEAEGCQDNAEDE